MENPYQTPSLESQSSGTECSEQKSKPLRWPAFGCLLTGGLWLTMNVAQMYILWNLYTAMRTFNDKQATQRVQRINEAFLETSVSILFGLLALFIAWSMYSRRNRWTVYCSSILGMVLCAPAPLAVIIFLRIRRKEVWDSFDKPAKASNLMSGGS
ncbi:MAG: hypothetical protein ACO1RA_20865 [Planctomycetaceae bacterium]